MPELVLWLMYLAGAACVVTLAEAIRRTWLAARHGEEVLQRVAVLGREGRTDEVEQVTRSLPGAVSAVVRAGIAHADEAAAEAAMRVAARGERDRLRRLLRALEWIGAVALLAPLAALLFAMFAGPDPMDLAAPGPADRPLLRAAAAGLAIASVATLGRYWLLGRIDRLAVEMEKGAAVVYNTAR